MPTQHSLRTHPKTTERWTWRHCRRSCRSWRHCASSSTPRRCAIWTALCVCARARMPRTRARPQLSSTSLSICRCWRWLSLPNTNTVAGSAQQCRERAQGVRPVDRVHPALQGVGRGEGSWGGGEKAKRAPRRRAAAAITKTRQLTPPHPSFSHHTNKNRTAHPRQLALALRADAGDVEPAQARDRAHAQVVCAACCALCALCCCACVLRGVCVCVCVCLRETAGAPASSAARP